MAEIPFNNGITQFLRRLGALDAIWLLGGVDWQMGKMPADFLIGPNGRIVKAHYGRNFGDHLTVVEIEAALSELGSPK